MNMLTLAIALLLASFLYSVVVTAIMTRISLWLGFVARPTADRYHRSVIPLGGGIAIVDCILIFLIAGILIVKFVIAPGRFGLASEEIAIHAQGFLERTPQLLIVIACILALFILGLADDIRKLGPKFKLLVQFAVAFAAASFADIHAELFIHNTGITTALSVFWIVLVINAFNFLDNMDGAAAGIAIIIAAVLLTAAALSQQIFISAMAILFIGSLTGFLFFNFPPAKIFMGDAGSLPLGFMLALLTLKTTYYHEAGSGGWYPVLIPLIAMAVPLYDFTSVTLLRLSQGKSPFVGDTQHFSHRLKRHGLSDAQTALTLYLATFCTALGATFLYQVDLKGAILIALQTLMILAIIAIFESTVKNEGKTQDTKSQTQSGPDV